MDSERWKKISALYHQASELEGEARDRFLADACNSDDDLRREVEALLGVTGDAASGIGRVVETATAEYADHLGSIKQIGPYRVLRVIGHGGMGQVFLAERADQEFERQVAIKTIPWMTVTPALIERFRQERQILANLDHPNIARMLDGGSSDEDMPYLVMEYVAGQNIIEYCQENNLSLKRKLDLFLQICDAVQYAHRKLVIHRDVKPSNILVTAEGSPKLLDFGIAKLLDADAAVTRADMRFMTQQYASPELVRGEAASTATDIYGLGLLLYELLTDKFPYPVEGSTSVEIERLILETQPVAPSLAVANGNSRIPNLKGDLDNIVLMALRKEPERRYQSAKDLADDVRNFLTHRPVIARTATYRYRTGKFVYRHRLGVVAVTTAILAAITMTAFYTVQLAEQRDIARFEAAKAQEVVAFLTNLFTEADPQRSLGQPVSARQMLDSGAVRIIDELASQPELQAALMATIGESYRNMSELNAAREHLTKALKISEPALGITHLDVLKMRYLLGITTSFIGNFEEALALHQPDYEYLVGEHGQRSLEAATMLHQIAFVESRTGLHEQSESHFLELIDIFRSHGDAARAPLATGLMGYGTLLQDMGRQEESGTVLLEAVDIRKQIYGTQHPEYAAVINNLGNHYLSLGQTDDAEPVMEENIRLNRQLYGENSLPYAVAINNYSTLRSRLGDHEGSLELLLEAESIFRVGYGPESPRYAYTQENIANVLANLERGAEAEPYYESALAILEKLFGTEHVEYAITQSSYAGYLNAAGQFDAAVPELQHVINVFQSSLGPENNRTIAAGYKFAGALHGLGRSEEALAVLIPNVEIIRANESISPQTRIWTLGWLALIYHDTGRFEQALPVFAEALEFWELLGAIENPRHFDTEYAYVQTLMTLKRYEEAESRLLKRREQFATTFGENDEHTLQVIVALEELYERREGGAEN